MSEIYFPEKLILGQEEKDLYPYNRRVSTSFCVAFTLNQSTQMFTGNRYKDNLDACLTAVSWIEDHLCEIHVVGIGLNMPKHDRIIKTTTFYMDKGGYIVSGHYHELKYLAQRILSRPTAANDDTIDKIIELKSNFTRMFISGSEENLLHKEIFIDKVFKIKGFPEFKINTQSDFYKLLQTVSIYNRSMDMSFVYSIAQGKKILFEDFKKIIAIASIPIQISAQPYVRALQGSIALFNYLCTLDNVVQISDKLFDFRGPVVISDIYDVSFGNKDLDLQNGIIPKPKKESTSRASEQDALNDFLDVETIISKQIKNIKEPIDK